MNYKQLYIDWGLKYHPWHTVETLEESADFFARQRAKVEFVQSRFRTPWKGVIIKREKRKGRGDLCTVQVIKDRHGNWMRKVQTRTIDEHWLVPCAPWFIEKSPWSFYPRDWAEILETRAKVVARRLLVKKLKRQWRGLE